MRLKDAGVGRLGAIHEPIHGGVVGRIAELVGQRSPRMPTDLLRHAFETTIAALMTQMDRAEIVCHKSLAILRGNLDRILGGGGLHDRLLHEKAVHPMHFQYGEPIKPTGSWPPS